jgi:hypothetical protein
MLENEYYICDGWGESIDLPTVKEMQKFLDKLDIDDEEHCEVWLDNSTYGWTLSCFPSNRVVFLSNEDKEETVAPRHLKDVSREKMLNLWQKLASGKIIEVEKEPWLPGYTSKLIPPPPDPKDIHQDFWNVLITAERKPNLICNADQCEENPIGLSVFCPKHHFEMIKKIPCPF